MSNGEYIKVEEKISEAVDSINKNIFEDERVKKYNLMSFEIVKNIIEYSVREGFIKGVDYAMEELMRRLDD